MSRGRRTRAGSTEAGRTGGRPGKGFGLTVDVVLDAVEAHGDHRSTRQLRLSGAFGTTFWIDPQEDRRVAQLVLHRSSPPRLRGRMLAWASRRRPPPVKRR